MKPYVMGVYDDPQNQQQPLYQIDLLSGHVAVFGGSGKGKTTFLKTLLVRMHENLQKDEEERCYILDFGGTLGKYSGLSQICAFFDSSNEENIKRVFRTLEEGIESNTKILDSENFQNYYRDPKTKEKRPPHMTLIIDNINSFLADERYQSYQELLIQFCRDGLSKGLTVIFTANDVANGVGRLLSNFSYKIAFEVAADKYIEIFGFKAIEVMSNPGRAIVNIKSNLYEMQCFLPFTQEAKELPVLVESVKQFSHSEHKLRSFSDTLTMENYEQYCEDMEQYQKQKENPNAVIVGLDYYHHKTISVDFTECNCIGIYGKRKFGKTNLLRVMLQQFAEKNPNCRFVLFDDGRNQLAEFKTSFSNVLYTKKMEVFMKELKQFLPNTTLAMSFPYDTNADDTLHSQGMGDPLLGSKTLFADTPSVSKPEVKKAEVVVEEIFAMPSAQPAYDTSETEIPESELPTLLPEPELPMPPSEKPHTIFVLQAKEVFNGDGRIFKYDIPELLNNSEENKCTVIYSDVRKISDGELVKFFNNSISAAFLLDNIGEFVADRGSGDRSVFGDMNAKELKQTYAKCSIGDGYYYDVDSEDLQKLKFIMEKEPSERSN